MTSFSRHKIFWKFFAYSCISEHSRHFFFFPTKTYIFLADKGYPLADLSAKNVSFFGGFPKPTARWLTVFPYWNKINFRKGLSRGEVYWETVREVYSQRKSKYIINILINFCKNVREKYAYWRKQVKFFSGLSNSYEKAGEVGVPKCNHRANKITLCFAQKCNISQSYLSVVCQANIM